MQIPLVILVAPTVANLWIWGCAIALVAFAAIPIQTVRVINDKLAKGTCDRQKAKAKSDVEKQVWEWQDFENSPRLTPAVTGIVERLFFLMAAYFWLPGLAIAAVGWITLKMAMGWTILSNQAKGQGAFKAVAFSRLRTSVASVMLALFVGVISRGIALSYAT